MISQVAGSVTTKAWHMPQHGSEWRRRRQIGNKELRKRYERLADFRLLKRYRKTLRGTSLYDVGCASGEAGWCIRQNYPQFLYTGFDISQSAIDHAVANYPTADFETCDEDLSGIRETPAILYCRDVVHHQPNPFEFLSRLLSIPAEAALIRLRTRDIGPTVLDAQKSHQHVYGETVPYIFVNIGELLALLLDVRPVSFVHIIREHKSLEGGANRHLPDGIDASGAAMSSVWLSFGDTDGKPPRIIID